MEAETLGQVWKLLRCSAVVRKGSCACKCEGKPGCAPRDRIVHPGDFCHSFCEIHRPCCSLWSCPSPCCQLRLGGRSLGRGFSLSDVLMLFHFSGYWQLKLKSSWCDLKRKAPGCSLRLCVEDAEAEPLCLSLLVLWGIRKTPISLPLLHKRAFSSCLWKMCAVVSFALVSA